jgi:Ca2+/Na+ antiporter
MQGGCVTVCYREYGDDLWFERIAYEQVLIMTDDLIYNERVSSNRTEALFLALTILFFLLLIWRVNAGGLDILAAIFFCLFSLFFFYSVNYRTLIIRLTSESLKLTFGIFTWRVPLDNVGECCLDDIPMLMRMGGAGIHFMSIRKRYRASFNFLEHPRVVIAFKRKEGLVRDISFSTRRPDDVLWLIQEAVSANSKSFKQDKECENIS